MMGTRRPWIAASVLVLLATTTVACSSRQSADPTPSGAPASGTAPATSPQTTEVPDASPTMSSADQLTAQILGGATGSAAVATVKGNLQVQASAVPVVAEILEVRAGAASTLLRWQLKSASGQQVQARGYTFSRPPLFDTRAVALRDTTGKRVLMPFTYVPQKSDLDNGCVCSQIPQTVGAAAEPLYALYPPLAPSTTAVDVTLPGFAVAKGVPVTRR